MSPADWIALAAIGAATLTSLATLWWTDRRSRDSESRIVRKEAASVLGRVFVLLVDANPVRWAITGSPADTAKRHEDLLAKWESVRPELNGVAASYPVASVRTAAFDLDVALHNAVVSSLWLVSPNPPGGMGKAIERANADYPKAEAIAQHLAELLRSS